MCIKTKMIKFENFNSEPNKKPKREVTVGVSRCWVLKLVVKVKVGGIILWGINASVRVNERI